MFSELIKKKVAKFMAIIMLICNISPAIAMQRIIYPEYSERMERRNVLNPVTGAMVQGFLVEAQKLVVEQAVQTYQTIFSQVVAPFMLATAAIQTGMMATAVTLYEILQKTKAETQQIGLSGIPQQPLETAEELDDDIDSYSLREMEPKLVREINADAECESSAEEEDLLRAKTPNIEEEPQSSTTSTVGTELSRGFCLSIPELGDLLISHEGDVVFGQRDAGSGHALLGKSLRITAPSQIILNNATAKHIDVEVTTAFLMGASTASIDFLKFHGIGGVDVPTNGLFIDREAALQVGELSLEDALLLNTGQLSVTKSLDLNGEYFFNSGKFLTSANPSVLRNIAYMFNGSTGSMTASGRMVLGADRFSNLGSVRAQSLSVVTSDLFDNQGTFVRPIASFPPTAPDAC